LGDEAGGSVEEDPPGVGKLPLGVSWPRIGSACVPALVFTRVSGLASIEELPDWLSRVLPLRPVLFQAGAFVLRCQAPGGVSALPGAFVRRMVSESKAPFAVAPAFMEGAASEGMDADGRVES
jgi:hypothetical protein